MQDDDISTRSSLSPILPSVVPSPSPPTHAPGDNKIGVVFKLTQLDVAGPGEEKSQRSHRWRSLTSIFPSKQTIAKKIKSIGSAVLGFLGLSGRFKAKELKATSVCESMDGVQTFEDLERLVQDVEFKGVRKDPSVVQKYKEMCRSLVLKTIEETARLYSLEKLALRDEFGAVADDDDVFAQYEAKMRNLALEELKFAITFEQLSRLAKLELFRIALKDVAVQELYKEKCKPAVAKALQISCTVQQLKEVVESAPFKVVCADPEIAALYDKKRIDLPEKV